MTNFKNRLILSVVFLIPFLAYNIYIWNDFYNSGALFLDTGWFASLMYKNGLALINPDFFNNGSFLNTHFSPFLIVWSLFSYLWPLGMPSWFALYFGLAFALMSVGAYSNLVRGEQFSWPSFACAAVTAIAIPFSTLAYDIASFPHYEVMIPGLAFIGLGLLFSGRTKTAMAMLILTCSVREDAGFHIVAILGLVIVLRKIQGESWRSMIPLISCGMLVFFLSIAAILAQKFFFHGDNALSAVYMGNPPYAHLSSELILTRIRWLWEWRPSLFIAPLVTFTWAVLARNPYIVLGYVAYIPWTVFNLTASLSPAGHLSSYYSYPYLIALMWPIIGSQIGQPTTSLSLRLLGQALVLSGAFAGWNPSILSDRFTPHFELNSPAIANRFTTFVQRERPRLGRIGVDHGIPFLSKGTFNPDELLWEEGCTLPWVKKTDGLYDTLIYFERGYPHETVMQLQKKLALPHLFKVVGMPIRILSINADLGDDESVIRKIDPSDFTTQMTTSSDISKNTAGINIPTSAKSGIVVYGPYVSLDPGRWTAEYRLASKGAFTMDIYDGIEIRGVTEIPASEDGERVIRTSFVVTPENRIRKIEFRLWKKEALASAHVIGVSLKPAK
jgi:hypothetical protein